jgi:hypothetical protein
VRIEISNGKRLLVGCDIVLDVDSPRTGSMLLLGLVISSEVEWVGCVIDRLKGDDVRLVGSLG